MARRGNSYTDTSTIQTVRESLTRSRVLFILHFYSSKEKLNYLMKNLSYKNHLTDED